MFLDYMAPTSSSNDSSLETDHSFQNHLCVCMLELQLSNVLTRSLEKIFFKKVVYIMLRDLDPEMYVECPTWCLGIVSFLAHFYLLCSSVSLSQSLDLSRILV